MNFAVAASYATAALGLAVVVWWAWRVRGGRDPLGAQPQGAFPDTGDALLIAIPAWIAAMWIVPAIGTGAGLSAGGFTILGSAVHLAIALVILPFVRRGVPAPTLTPRALRAAGWLAGLATFGVVGLTGELLTLGYAAFGAKPPEQDVVALARSVSGVEQAGTMLATLVLAPVGEEIFWRGAVMPAIARRTGMPRAVLLSGAAFGAIHVAASPPAWWPLAIPLGLVGAICGWTYARTASLSAAIRVHVAFNALNLVFLHLSAN
ncbi:MAG: CPBP family intramembrane metalloprotease [Planctomycetes bacterium]|nr:CPBP family intramembrane metalloprotease [Planctomycetota bacterium]